MQKLIWQNANGDTVDLTSGNYGITEWEGFSNAGLNVQSQQVPFQDGAVFLDALIEPRELSVTLAMQDNNNLELRYQLRRELIHILNPKLGEGYLIYTNDFTSKRIKCIPQIPLFQNKNSNDSGTPKASLAWTACEPYWEDLEETVVELEAGETVQIENEGDVPAQVKIKLTSGVSNPFLYNEKNHKQIGLNGSYSDDVFIDTNNGQKTVEINKEEYKWSNGGVFYNVCFGQEKFIIGGDVIVVIDLLTNKTYSPELPKKITIKNIIYANNLFIICGSGNSIMTSTNGLDWKLRYSEDDGSESINDVVYANNKYIAVGDSINSNGTILTSTDGENWTQIISGIDKSFNGITYGKGMFIIVGNGGTILTSTDGENWTTRPIDNVYHYEKIACSGYIFVAVSLNSIIYSYDGINWTTEENSNIGMTDIKYIKNQFIAVGIGGKIRISNDGLNWSVGVTGINNINLNGVNYAYNIYLAVGANATILQSTDGIEWVVRNGGIMLGTIALYDVVYANNKYIAVGDYYIAKSTDGEQWVFSSVGSAKLKKIAYGNNKYIAVGDNGVILTSEDGSLWESKTSGVSVNLLGICFNSEIFIVVGNAGKILTSSDGENWTQQTSGTVYTLYDVIYANGKIVAIEDNAVLISEDGITWTKHEDSFSLYKNGIAYGNNIFVIAGVGQTVLTSPDGIIFTERALKKNYSINKLVFNGNIFIAVGELGNVITSLDGIIWEEIKIGTRLGFNGVNYGNKKNILVGSYQIIFSSFSANMQNIISNLVQNSDMTFNLEQGQNNILYLENNNTPATLSYRQKYIGV